MIKTAILIPAYEPDGKLINLINELMEYDKKVIVVNDGSNSKYDSIFQSVSNKGATVINHEFNRGKGAALKTGIEWCYNNGYEGVVTADSDGQHAVKDIVNICKKVEEDNDKLILGVRKIKNMPAKSKFGNTLTRFLFKVLYGVDISDTQTGLRGIPLKNRKDGLLNLSGNRYEYEMNMLIYAQRLDYTIEEIDIDTIYYDQNEGSHFNPIKDGIKIYAVLFKNIPSFLISSLASFLIDYGIFNILVYAIGVGVLFSTVLARIVSASFNYCFNKKIVFKKSGKRYNAINYIKLACAILAINCCLIYLLVEVLGLNAYLAKILVEVILYSVSFATQNMWAYSRERKK